LFASNEVVLEFLDMKYLSNTCIETISTGLEFFISRFALDDITHFSQKDVYKKINDELDCFSVETYLQRKLFMRIDVVPEISLVNSLVLRYRTASRKFGFAITFSHVRAVCNHWCTRSRFGNKTSGCCFGCGHISDRIAHTLICPRFWEFFFSLTHYDCQPLAFIDVLLLTLESNPFDGNLSDLLLIGTHICFLSYHSCKGGKTLDRRLVQHFLSHYCRSHPRVGRFIAMTYPNSPST
jgi:hypothetical protein